MCFNMIIFSLLFFSYSVKKRKKFYCIGPISKTTREKVFRTNYFPLYNWSFHSLTSPSVQSYNFNLEWKMNSQKILIALCILDNLVMPIIDRSLPWIRFVNNLYIY